MQWWNLDFCRYGGCRMPCKDDARLCVHCELSFEINEPNNSLFIVRFPLFLYLCRFKVANETNQIKQINNNKVNIIHL